jgi:hypothetical protein
MRNHWLIAFLIGYLMCSSVGCKKTSVQAPKEVATPQGTPAARNDGKEKDDRAIETRANASGSAIRAVDLKEFVAAHIGEFNPDLADLKTACEEGQQPLQNLAPPVYGDLDQDGQEEAIVEGWSCLSGNGGADFRGVVKLLPDGKLISMPIEVLPKTFKGRDTYAGLRGHMVVTVKNGKLEEQYGIYTGNEANCCPEGGERHFVYKWDGQKFVLDDMMDMAAEKTEN